VITLVGDGDPAVCSPIMRGVEQILGLRTRKNCAMLADLEFAYDLNRDQYHSTPVLDRLAQLLPAGAMRVLAVTGVDLFIPILTHVYGEAQLGGRACIVSTARLKEGLAPLTGQDTYLNRVVKEAVHELGHTFGLRHCPDPACIMHYCRSIRDVDRKSDQLCRYCKILFEDELKRMRKR